MDKSEHVVVLTGAGISAESGLKTFRDSDGLWEGYDVTEVATPEAWARDPELVLQFYNERREQVYKAKPNPAHIALVELEKRYSVTVVTQNIDNLHERAGSSNVLHLHGEIFSARSSLDAALTYQIEGCKLLLGEKCERGSQLRPDIVWFGEAVPMMDRAIEVVRAADIFLIIGTSLVVYPAASLVEFARDDIPKFLVDRSLPQIGSVPNFEMIERSAAVGVPGLVTRLLAR